MLYMHIQVILMDLYNYKPLQLLKDSWNSFLINVMNCFIFNNVSLLIQIFRLDGLPDKVNIDIDDSVSWILHVVGQMCLHVNLDV